MRCAFRFRAIALVLCLLLILVCAKKAIKTESAPIIAPQTEQAEEAPYENFESQVIIPCTTLSSRQNRYGEVPKLPEKGKLQKSYDAESKTLTISGSGNIIELYPREILFIEGFSDSKPLRSDATIEHLIIKEGISGIYNSFCDLTALQSISFPESLLTIQDSFINCDQLSAVEFPKNLNLIRYEAFADCDGITSLQFNGPVLMDHPSFRITRSLDEADIETEIIFKGLRHAPFRSLDRLEEVRIYGAAPFTVLLINAKISKRPFWAPIRTSRFFAAETGMAMELASAISINTATLPSPSMVAMRIFWSMHPLLPLKEFLRASII